MEHDEMQEVQVLEMLSQSWSKEWIPEETQKQLFSELERAY